MPRGRKGKKDAHAGVRGKQKDWETKEWEQNDFRKAQEDDEEGKKMENRKKKAGRKTAQGNLIQNARELAWNAIEGHLIQTHSWEKAREPRQIQRLP
jgi:hypothetical protein